MIDKKATWKEICWILLNKYGPMTINQKDYLYFLKVRSLIEVDPQYSTKFEQYLLVSKLIEGILDEETMPEEFNKKTMEARNDVT